ncbi:unnamed protein product [Gongylonema pulchrum]|uniref:Exocyst complex component Sec8 n=1 Tax=Gongylonema pulchrum TaxID=637853 RepID=A0A183D3W9_9BILA|nr:unnamed protein product [Gongylonema pulchrum]
MIHTYMKFFRISMLCDEVYNDLAMYFDQLFIQKSYNSSLVTLRSISLCGQFSTQLLCNLFSRVKGESNAAGTICETVRDYESDYRHLRRAVHIEVLRCIELRIVAEYLNAIASRKITCTEFHKRCAVAKRLKNDAAAIMRTFDPLLSPLEVNGEEMETLPNVLHSMAEFISLRDKSMLPLEIASLLQKYPDITEDLLFSLIDARDDVTSTESRALTEECTKMIDKKRTDPELAKLFHMAKGERKTSQIIRDVVPRLRRRVKVSIAGQ